MNTPLSWIKAYVPELECTAQEYTDAMTLSGTKVEGYERLDKNLEKIVVGQIVSIEKHPDAEDKLVDLPGMDRKRKHDPDRNRCDQHQGGRQGSRCSGWRHALPADMTAPFCRRMASRLRKASFAA